MALTCDIPASLLNHTEAITASKVAFALVRVGRQHHPRLAACIAEPAAPAEDGSGRPLLLRDSLEDVVISLHPTVPCLIGDSMAELEQQEGLKQLFDAIASFTGGSTFRLRNIAEVAEDSVISATEELRLRAIAEGQEQQAAAQQETLPLVLTLPLLPPPSQSLQCPKEPLAERILWGRAPCRQTCRWADALM